MTAPGSPAPIVPPATVSRARVRPLDLPFTVDLGALALRTEGLPPELRVAHARFLLRLWRWGDVLRDEANLAEAFGLRLRAFRNARDRLARLFTIDAAGGWRDLDVEDRRAAALSPPNGQEGSEA